MAIGGRDPGRWEIVLRHPLDGFAGRFRLSDRACSTSATFSQTLSVGSTVLSHVVDPRTGHPLRTTAQVTVVASSATIAEALSTALLVLGRAHVHEVAERFEVEVCWIDESGIDTTPRFGLRRLA